MKHQAKVISGYGRGKFLGYPTLNLTLPQQFSYKQGIYAGWVWLETDRYMGAFHYGPVPTFDQKEPSLEVFVLDKTIHQPPETITFELIQWLRRIVSFESKQALISQIKKDVAQTNRILDKM